ncbi:MAG: hypothetical protein MUP17_08140 [candidate division Zixibacteria bacterium]|nr:hypothetical protein [candidate division Zixibacteria bacterium]
MNNKTKFVLGLTVLLLFVFVIFWFSPGLIFSNGQKIDVTAPRPNFPGRDTTQKPEPPKQEIRQVFEYKWNMPLDSCHGRDPYFWLIKFDPLPELNKPSKIYVRLKSCWDQNASPVGSHPIYKEGPLFRVYSDENILDSPQLVEPRWLYPIKKGDIYEGSITIIPRDVGLYRICFFDPGWACFNFGFNENGELVHLSDRGNFPIGNAPNHPAITDKEVYVKFNGKYVTNLFHISPPLSLNDTSTVDYRVVTKVDYPEGLKLITRDGANISFKMIPGPINKGDTLEGSFKAVPPRVGWNSIGLGVEEPPKQGIKPKNDSFSAQYNLLKDGQLLFIAKGQKGYRTLSSYYAKKGVKLEKL